MVKGMGVVRKERAFANMKKRLYFAIHYIFQQRTGLKWKILQPCLKLRFFMKKNPLYRTVYADGLIGGVTPLDSVNLSFYATRNPIPKSSFHEMLQIIQLAR